MKHATPMPIQCAVPASSRIDGHLQGAYFFDAWSVPAADHSLSALDYFVQAASETPGWVNALMALRNKAAALVGLKDLGGLSELRLPLAGAAYQPGDRVGIFTLIDNHPDEVLLGDKDKHLDVILSVHKSPPNDSGAVVVTITTVVHVNNLLGRLYMLPVAPIHRKIVPSIMRAIGRGSSGSSTVPTSKSVIS